MDYEHSDSEEDRVTYDDEIRTIGSEVKTKSNNRRDQSMLEAPKAKSLFQYRRFKGNIDTEDFSDCIPANFNSSFDDTTSGVRFDVTVLHSAKQSANNKPSTSTSNSIAQQNEVQQTTIQQRQQDPPPRERPRITGDVALDRPDHWKSSASFRRLQHAPDKPPINKKQKVPTSTQIPPRLKNTVISTGTSRLVTGKTVVPQNLQSVSFQPSWMNSNTFYTDSSSVPSNVRYLNNDRRQSSGEAIIEDDDEETTGRMRSPLRRNGNGMQMNKFHNTRAQRPPLPQSLHTHQVNTVHDELNHGYDNGNYDDYGPSIQSHNVSMHSEHMLSQVLPLSPPLSTYARTFGSSGYIERTGGGGARTSYSSAKARPGSLKARLFKILRESDANENRIVNIPQKAVFSEMDCAEMPLFMMTGGGGMVDLQDPRYRATSCIDVEVIQLLPVQSTADPFYTVRIMVLHTWCKEGVLCTTDKSISNHNDNTTSVLEAHDVAKQLDTVFSTVDNDNDTVVPTNNNSHNSTLPYGYQTPAPTKTTTTSLHVQPHSKESETTDMQLNNSDDTYAQMDTSLDSNNNNNNNSDVSALHPTLTTTILRPTSSVDNNHSNVFQSPVPTTGIITAATSTMGGVNGVNGSGGAVQRVYNNNEWLINLTGQYCTVYFKPSTCVGSERKLREGLSLRIYNPIFLGSIDSIITMEVEQQHQHRMNESTSTTDAAAVRIICTQCWEPLDSSVGGDAL